MTHAIKSMVFEDWNLEHRKNIGSKGSFWNFRKNQFSRKKNITTFKIQNSCMTENLLIDTLVKKICLFFLWTQQTASESGAESLSLRRTIKISYRRLFDTFKAFRWDPVKKIELEVTENYEFDFCEKNIGSFLGKSGLFWLLYGVRSRHLYKGNVCQRLQSFNWDLLRSSPICGYGKERVRESRKSTFNGHFLIIWITLIPMKDAIDVFCTLFANKWFAT